MRSSIQNRLTRTYISLAVVPIVVVGILASWQAVLFQREIYIRQEQLAERVAAEVESFLAELEGDLTLLIELEGHERLRQQNPFGPLFNLLAHEAIFEELAYLDATGQELNREVRLGIVTIDDYTNRSGQDNFEIPFRSRTTYFGPIRYSPITGEPILTIAVPVIDNRFGDVTGVFVGEARFRKVWDILASIPRPTGQSVYIVDEKGQVVAHWNSSVPLREVFFVLPETSGIVSGFDSAYVLMATETIRLGTHFLTVVVEQSILDAFALPRNLILTTIFGSLAAFALATLAGIRSVRQIVHPIQDLAATAREIRAGEWQQEISIPSNDELADLGEAFNLMIRRLKDGMAHLEEEVSERRQAEEALRNAENRYRILVEQLPAITYIDDITENIGMSTYVSPQIEAILGYTQQEWLNMNMENWIKMIHPEDREIFKQEYQKICEEGIPLNCEYRISAKNSDLIWLNNLAIRLSDEKGCPWVIQGVMFDITERKTAEEEVRRLNAQLEQRVQERTEQLEAANKELESFSYSISHDLRTPLRGIIGFSTLLLNNFKANIPDEGQHYLKRVRENAQRMGQLVDDLLHFSRLGRQSINKFPVSPASIVQEALNELTPEYEGRKVEITVENLPPCLADPSLLRQVYINLIGNALKYSREKENAQIRIGAEHQNQTLVYFVHDNGTGFDMQYAHKLFGVFQRLHNLETYEGTGVGLAITQRIIHRHGGEIWAEAEPGQGASFFFTLPPGSTPDEENHKSPDEQG